MSHNTSLIKMWANRSEREREREKTPGVKGTFHKGSAVWDLKHLFSFLKWFVRLSFSTKLERPIYFCLSFNVFGNGRFCTIPQLKSGWMATVFAATQTASVQTIIRKEADHTVSVALIVYLIQTPEDFFSPTLRQCRRLQCGFSTVLWKKWPTDQIVSQRLFQTFAKWTLWSCSYP